jgi:phage tail-like protein
MSSLRPFAQIDGADMWARAAHRETFLDFASGVVELAWSAPEATDAPLAGEVPEAAGLAFDAECRLYRSLPDAGRVERSLWATLSPGTAPVALDLFEAEIATSLGDFSPLEPATGAVREPRGLAVDVDDRLFVAETGAGRILVYDLWSQRLLRTLSTGSGTQPLDLAAHGRTVLATVRGSDVLLRFSARGAPEAEPLPPEVPAATRLAVSPGGRVAVLAGAGTEDALIVPMLRPRDALAVPRATDLEWESDEVLVVARHPGEEFRRFRLLPGAQEEMAPLVARAYDGLGIVRTPDGRMGYHSARGFRTAPVARVRYVRSGRVTAFRLDSGEYQTAWGRIFLDACIPPDTAVHVTCQTTDDTFDEPALPRTPPGNVVTLTVRRPDLSPPMPPLSLHEEEPHWLPLHRRESGRELAWLYPERGDHFVTYEAPVHAVPGRYLWVSFELQGDTRVSPRIRSLRVEHPGHDLLRRLPRAFSRDEPDASFLRRYLAIFDGLVTELENRAAHREILLDPHGTPEEMLPWLASFLGLALDERWPVPARRTLVREAARLFRYRGTIWGLSRFLEIYLGYRVAIVERFRLRGMGGAVLGEAGAPTSRAVLGGGFRVGGAVGEPTESPLEGTAEDAFRTHAHRFSVIVPGALTREQLDVVNHILEVHRPAHTLVEVCTVDAGMRVGRGLHVGLSSTIGRTGGFRTLQLGAAALGRGGVVGRPETGTLPGATRLGADSRVG